MQFNYKILFIGLLSIALFTACSSQKQAKKATKEAPTLDLTGAWTFTIQTPVGNRDTPVDLKQISETEVQGKLMEENTVFTLANDSIFYDMERESPIGLLQMEARGAVTENSMDGIYRFVGGGFDGTELTWSAKKN